MKKVVPIERRLEGRGTVLDEILAFNADFKPKRVRLKLRRMDISAFAFFRGTAHLFAAAWHELGPADPGPAAWLCGDLHLENFGAYRSDDGDYLFDINDFDEALVGPVAIDLVRCSASILLAAEEWQLSPLTASGMALGFLDCYRQALATTPAAHVVDLETPRLGAGGVWGLLDATALGTRRALLDHCTRPFKNGVRKIVLVKGKRSELGKRRAKIISDAVEAYGRSRPKPGAYQVLDVSTRIAGVGSLGLRRYLVLVEGDGSPDGNRLFDVKEARRSAMVDAAKTAQPDCGGCEARRVVEAQRRLQAKPVAGLDTLEIAGDWFRIREMIPEENRSSLDRLQRRPDRLREAVEMAGRLTGWAHLRGSAESGTRELIAWAAGRALDALLAPAARVAERTRVQYEEFHRALHAGQA